MSPAMRYPMNRFPAIGPALVLLAASWLIACAEPESRPGADSAGAGPVVESQQTGVQVLLVGIDGATFSVIDPLVAAGELPTFARLIAGGARAILQSDKPMRSPALWTTVATGRARDQHGVVHFIEPDDESGEPVLANSRMRRSLTVWDMLGAAGRSVGVVGWWATWPAEPVRGWLISDRMTRSRWSEWADGDKQTGLTYPPELAEELLPLVVDPGAPPMDEVRKVIDLDPADEAELRAVARPVRAHGLSVLKFALSNQLTYERITDHMLARGPRPDLTAVFLIANDAISHTYWHYHEPESFEGVDPEKLDRLGPVVSNVYRHNDDYLARLLAGADDSTVTIVISDHGFKASGKLPAPGEKRRLHDAFTEEFAGSGETLETVTVGQSGIHHPAGVFIAAGGPIVAGVATEATLFDLAPTLLALMGLPVPDDLPGRVLTEIVDPAFFERYPIRTLPTYERLIDRRALLVAADGENDESTMEMLRSLGYIQ